jgi:SAM-dependent methyltransferase
MTEPPHRYLLHDDATDEEVRRLVAIDELMGPITRQRVERVGIAPGWRCLEVGAGVGGVARWMAERVGPAGQVTATDLTPLLAADASLPQLEPRRHDILRREGLERDHYDLVHCRLLLANVGDVARALEHMVGALRPGGWLVVEEPGESRVPGIGEGDERVAEFNRLFERFLAEVRARTRQVDLELHRRLPSLLRAAGVVHLGGELTYPLVGAKGREALLGTLKALRPLLSGSDFATGGDHDRLAQLCTDDTLITSGGATVCLWGQRAA